MRYNAIIFDFDGTLFETSFLDGYYDELRKYPRDSAENKAIWKEIDSRLPEYGKYEGMDNVFDFIRENKINSVLVTGAVKRRYAKAIKYYNVPINLYVGRFDVGKRKPNPEPMLKGLKLLDCEAKDVISIGNQIIDMEASHAAGITFAACEWGMLPDEKDKLMQGADYVLKSPKDIINLISGYSMADKLPTWDLQQAIDEANENIFSHSLRAKVYRNNCKIIKANGYVTADGTPITITDKERLQQETVAYSAPTNVNSLPTVTSKTLTGAFEADCIYVGKALQNKGWNPAVLNLADEIWAGGFVHKGSCAQEEELCRRTTLTESLFPIHSAEFGERIGMPVTTIAYPMNKDYGGIYTPNATVIRDVASTGYALLKEPYSISIISVAAVNSPTIDYDKLEIKMPKAIEREKNKMRTILRIGLLHGHDSLVLGAFGCGAFHTPPSHVARLFAEVFEEPEFKNKYKGLFFAVLEGKKQEHNPEGNVKPFVEVFGRMELDNIPSADTSESAIEPKQEPITKKSQDNSQNTLIENIQSLMASRGYTQSSLAREMGKQPVVINRALNGKVPISPKMQMEIAQLFDVTIEELNGNITIPAAKRVQGFIKFNNGKTKDISSLKDLKTVYEDIIYQIEERPKEIERLIAECQEQEAKVKAIPHDWKNIDLYRKEEYNPREVYCWTFRKADEEKENVINSLGNMCSGFPFSINGHTFQGSEQAYIAGLFSEDTKECIAIQNALIKEGNGYAAKKTIRNRNERKYGRRDWEEFNVQWMLYVVWQKCTQNKEFAKLLKKVPRNAIIIENSALQTGETADFWGCKNDDWKAAVKKIADNADIVCAGKTAAAVQDRTVKDSNAITCVGTYKGVNCMGKILTICRDCLLDKSEPKIDYDLLRSKQIYILGELMKFDK